MRDDMWSGEGMLVMEREPEGVRIKITGHAGSVECVVEHAAFVKLVARMLGGSRDLADDLRDFYRR